MIAKAKSTDLATASVTRSPGAGDSLRGGGVFAVQCFDKDGGLKWEARTPNLVVNVGLKEMNQQFFTGANYTAGWFLGLYGAAVDNNPAAGDTMASHAGWVEVTAYTEATRPACSFGTATTANPSVIGNVGSAAVFTINGNAVVGGAFLTTGSAKGGSAGVLFSAADFQAPGDRSVVSGDVINLTYQFSLDAA
jgi:hypothetical protein